MFQFEDVHRIMYTFYSFYDCLPSQTAWEAKHDFDILVSKV